MNRADKTHPDTPSPLIQSVVAFDEHLRQFEQATESVRKAPLSCGKHLERMAEMLKDVTQLDEKLGEHVRNLVSVIHQVRDRQQQQAQVVLERAQALQQRTQEFQTLQEKYASLGHLATELNQTLQSALQATGGKPAPELWNTLTQVNQRLGEAAEQAQALEDEAQARDFSDLVRHADSLRQQVLSTRNRLKLLSDKIRGPDVH